MYTRDYSSERGIIIPESYGGTVLRDEVAEEPKAEVKEEPKVASTKNPWEEDESAAPASSEPKGSFLERLPFGNLFEGVFGKGKFGLQKLGTEEILIIATALFLIFSKSHDYECAAILLLLLFIN